MLPVARGQTLNTEYNADPSAYEEESVKMEDIELANPFGVIGDIMRTQNLRSAQPDQSLRSADSKLDKVTGLPVVDENNMVIGVISKKVCIGRSELSGCFQLLKFRHLSWRNLVCRT